MSTWECLNCLFKNPDDVQLCQVCQNEKREKKTKLSPKKPFLITPPVKPVPWKCKLCTYNNNYDSVNCGVCGNKNTSREIKPRSLDIFDEDLIDLSKTQLPEQSDTLPKTDFFEK